MKHENDLDSLYEAYVEDKKEETPPESLNQNAYKSLQDAVDASSIGSRILLDLEEKEEEIRVRKGQVLVIIGQGNRLKVHIEEGARAKLKVYKYESERFMVYVNLRTVCANFVMWSALGILNLVNFVHPNDDALYSIGIFIENGSAEIRNCKLLNYTYGIAMHGGQASIHFCELSHNGRFGAYLTRSASAAFYSSSFRNNGLVAVWGQSQSTFQLFDCLLTEHPCASCILRRSSLPKEEEDDNKIKRHIGDTKALRCQYDPCHNLLLMTYLLLR